MASWRLPAVVFVALVLCAGASALLRACADPAPATEAPTAGAPALPQRPAAAEHGPGSRAAEHEHDDLAHHDGEEIPPLPGEGRAAGTPEQTARAFALSWVNRSPDREALVAQGERLVALSVGGWAREVAATFDRAHATGFAQGASEGSVVLTRILRHSDRSAEVLVVTRERLLVPVGSAPLPVHYATYVARLVATDRGAFAVLAWEPQLG